jgi:hypothetical protein
MCITCGCDSPEDDHGEPRNLTLEDFRQAADAAEVDLNQLLENIEKGLKRYATVEREE